MDYKLLRVDVARRIITIGCDIEQDLVAELMGAIAELHSKNQKKPVSLFINSYGGCMSAALALYDILHIAPLKINGVVLGNCMSAAVLILQACKERILFPHSRVMLHDGTTSIHTIPARDLKASAKNDAWLDVHYNGLIAKRAGTTARKIDQLRRRCSYLDAKQAIKLGLADSILSKVARR